MPAPEHCEGARQALTVKLLRPVEVSTRWDEGGTGFLFAYNDLIVNPLKAKQLTNIRTTSKDEAVRLTPIVPMTLEQAIAYIDDDELVEVTPRSIRLRKQVLNPSFRKKRVRPE